MKFGSILREPSPVPEQGQNEDGAEMVASAWSRLMSPQSKLVPPQSRLMSPQSRLTSPQSRLMSPQSHVVAQESHNVPSQCVLVSPQSHLVSTQCHLVSPQTHPMPQQSHFASSQSMLPGQCPPGHALRHTPKPAEVSPGRRQWTRSLDKCAGIEEEWVQTPPNNNHFHTMCATGAQIPGAVDEQSAAPALTSCQQRWQRNHTYQQLHCSSNNRCMGAGRVAYTRVSAYYSARPPAAPLQLVPVCLATPPGLPMHSSTSSPPPTGDFAMHLDDERCKKAVRSVLCELLAALPLSAPCSPQPRSPSHPRACTTLRPAPTVPTIKHGPHAARSNAHSEPIAPIMLVVSPTTKNCGLRGGVKWRSVKSDNTDLESVVSAAGAAGADPVHVRRHVATQAHVTGCARSDDGVQDRTNNADEWFGGVRALRDSHVRLVLRQLRHIERLNRALDRVGRITSPPPAPLAPSVRELSTPSTPIHNVH